MALSQTGESFCSLLDLLASFLIFSLGTAVLLGKPILESVQVFKKRCGNIATKVFALPTEFNFNEVNSRIQLVGLTVEEEPIVEYDRVFKMDLS